MTESTSIHHRRRWFYVLWVGLLVLSLAALYLWRTPVPMGDWTLRLKVRVNEAQGPVKVRMWFGPESLLRQGTLESAWDFHTETLLPDTTRVFPELRAPLKRRRWTRHPYPHANGEVLVLVFSQDGQRDRYLAIPLREDLWAVLMRHKRVTSLDIEIPWPSLPLEPRL